MPLTKVKGLIADYVNELYETGEFEEEYIIDSLIEIAHEYVRVRIEKIKQEKEALQLQQQQLDND